MATENELRAAAERLDGEMLVQDRQTHAWELLSNRVPYDRPIGSDADLVLALLEKMPAGTAVRSKDGMFSDGPTCNCNGETFYGDTVLDAILAANLKLKEVANGR